MKNFLAPQSISSIFTYNLAVVIFLSLSKKNVPIIMFSIVYSFKMAKEKKSQRKNISKLKGKIWYQYFKFDFLLFSIKITEESMLIFQTLPSIQSYLHTFDHILSTAQKVTPASQNNTAIQNNRGEVQTYSPIQARSVLFKLIEKKKVGLHKKNWKAEQTNLLCFIVDKYQTAYGIVNKPLEQTDWNKISQSIPYRAPSECRFRYLSLNSPNISQQPWSESESQMLFRLAQPLEQEPINWKKISQRLYECGVQKIYRTGKQCREHYTCFLRPNLKKGQWTRDQDYRMICLFLKQGKKWSKMTKYIEGRNQNSIKNRFFLIFENKFKSKLSLSDLVKLARRKKEQLQTNIKNAGEGSLDKDNQSILEVSTQQVGGLFQSCFQQQFSQVQNQQIIAKTYGSKLMNKQEFKIEGRAKDELGFTEDFQKYIDL